MDNGLPQDKPVTLKDVEQINKEKHHKNMQNKIHRIDDSYQLPGEKPMSTADKPTSKFMDAMTQVLANEAEIMEKKKMTQGDIAALAGDPEDIDAEDFAALRAKKHLKKEEVESLDELSDDTLTNYGKAALNNQLKRQSNLEPGEKTSRQIENRKKGQERQLKKQGIWNPSTKEEVEPLAELSKSTLKNYIKKASGADGGSNKSLPTLAAATGRHSERSQVASKSGDMDTMRTNRKAADKSFDKSWNRRKGIGMAADKLAKESYELDEALTDKRITTTDSEHKRVVGDLHRKLTSAGYKPQFQSTNGPKGFTNGTMDHLSNPNVAKDKSVIGHVVKYKNDNGHTVNMKILHKGNIRDDRGDKTENIKREVSISKLNYFDAKPKKPNLPESYEMNEAATVLLRKGGATKRMRYNPATIARLKGEGWVVAAEAFVDKVKALFDIAEDISFEDALSLVEAVDEVKRGRGRPKKAVDPNAAPKREWKPGGRGRPPKNKDTVTKVSTSDTAAAKAASPEPKAADDATDTGHILDHLRKAISTNGTNSFRQKNGSMAKVSQSAALALLSHHDKLPKASDRFAMQQHMAKSPEHLQGAIKNVAAGKPYNAGYEAKAKAKVSLAPKNWNDKK